MATDPNNPTTLLIVVDDYEAELIVQDLAEYGLQAYSTSGHPDIL